MGTSFTQYRGHGFWTRDARIEFWLLLLAQEIGRLEDPPSWLRVARDDWTLQATVGFNGCVSAHLDEHAGTTEQRERVLELLQRATARLVERGETLSVAWLNGLGLSGPGSSFTSDLSTASFLPVGDALGRLLRGEISWDASTSPVV